MPILSPELLSSWYAITLSNNTFIVDSWNENLQQDVNNKSFIQGDIANRIIEVNNPLHQATISGPILILKDLDAELNIDLNSKTFINTNNYNYNQPPINILDVFDLLILNLNAVSKPINEFTDLPYFIDNASVSINFSDIITTITLNSVYPQGFEKTLNSGFSKSSALKVYGERRILGRTAKFWDMRFRIFGDFYAVTQANFSVTVNSERKTHIGNNYWDGFVNPDFLITGYTITGDATISILPDQFENFRMYQMPGSFNVFQNSIGFSVTDRYRGNRLIDFGNYIVLPRIELDMRTGQLITARISFSTFIRRSV